MALAEAATEATAAGVAARMEAVGGPEAGTAMAAATAAVEAPVDSPMEEEGGTMGEERAVMAGATGSVGDAAGAMVGARVAPTGEKVTGVEVVPVVARMEVVIGGGALWRRDLRHSTAEGQ